MTLKKLFGRQLKNLFSLLNGLVPKKDKNVVFITNPDFTGNGMAFYEYLKLHHEEYQLIWLLKADGIIPQGKDIYVKQKSIKALWLYVTSKYIVTTHNEMIGIKAYNQIYLSLWHGMPLKKIGYLTDTEAKKMEAFSAQRIATSELMRAIIASSFKEDASNVHVLGQPRNDYLFKSLNILSLHSQNKIINKKIFYMPTFRKNTSDDALSDGEAINHDNFLRVLDFNLTGLNIYLQKNNCQLFLKFHPYEEKLLPVEIESENIKIITSDYCKKKNIEVNSILAEADILITDYSSVYFDYLILNKPIIFLIPDVENYSSQRGGYTLEPLDYWMPGKKVYSQHELLNGIDELLSGNDNFRSKREEVNSLINRFSDDKNSQRLYEKFFEANRNE